MHNAVTGKQCLKHFNKFKGIRLFLFWKLFMYVYSRNRDAKFDLRETLARPLSASMQANWRTPPSFSLFGYMCTKVIALWDSANSSKVLNLVMFINIVPTSLLLLYLGALRC
jgi:hypothetical protein